jgi:diguanylate cyclase (GGDEF)-like protein
MTTSMNSDLRPPRVWLRWLPVVVGLLTATVLFTFQQFHYSVQDSRENALNDAESLLAYAELLDGQHVTPLQASLALAAKRFDAVISAYYCNGAGCVSIANVKAGSSCSQAGSDWKSLCVTTASRSASPASISIRYSLRQAHTDTLRDLAFFLVILGTSTVIGVLSTSKMRARARRAEKRLRHSATHDALTDLPNRAAFEHRTARFIDAVNDGGPHGVLLFLDLDGFNAINDRFGHNVGNRMLCVTAERIRRVIGATDIVGRLGGDEFGVLITGNAARVGANEKAGELIRRLSEPVSIDGHTFATGASIGAVVLEPGVVAFDEALRRCDVALHEVKRHARGQLRYFTREMDDAARLKYELQNELKVALRTGQLFLEYQPQVDTRGALRGVEALVRWQHPTRGLIRPDQFISLAEDCGLILPLGLQVAEMACADLVRARALGMHLPYVSVNVSPKQLDDASLVVQLTDTLDRHGLGPRDLELEVTESSLMESQGADEAIRCLAHLGFRIAIDDFGTGYSSLSRLHDLPVHKLKIDRSFVMQLSQGGRGVAIAESVLDLARRLQLKTVAEGVETEAQATWLRDAGCTLMQGYLFARPMPFDRLVDWAPPGDGAPGSVWAESEPFAEV